MPISNSENYNRLQDFVKQGTSGQISEGEYNRISSLVEMELFAQFLPFYSINQKVQDALSPFVIPVAYANTSATGTIPTPADYVQLDTASYKNAQNIEFPVQKMSSFTVAPTQRNTVRNRNTANGEIGVYVQNNTLNFIPKEVMNISYTYIRKPVFAVIELVPTVTPTEDYLSIGLATTNYEWPESVGPLLFYMMLEKMGYQMREQIFAQYAMFGINREQVHTNPAPTT